MPVLVSMVFTTQMVGIATIGQWYLGMEFLGMHMHATLTLLACEKGMRF
jgi:hypothetical protein